MRKLFVLWLILPLVLPFELISQSIPTDFVRIRNRWKPDNYINIETGPLVAGPVQVGFLSAMWTLQPVGDGVHYRIQNRWKPDVFIHVERPQLEAGPIHAGAWSAMWVLERVGDGTHFRLKNRWKTDQYLHVETGSLQAGPIHAGAWSAMWTFQPLNAWPGDTASPSPNPPTNTVAGIPLVNENVQKNLSMKTNYFFFQAWNGSLYAAQILQDNNFLVAQNEKFENTRKQPSIDLKGASSNLWRVSLKNDQFLLQKNGQGAAKAADVLNYLSAGNSKWRLSMSLQQMTANRTTLSVLGGGVKILANTPVAYWSNPDAYHNGTAPQYKYESRTYIPDYIFYNGGGYVAKFQVDWYDIAGNLHTWHSGDTPVGQRRTFLAFYENRKHGYPAADYSRPMRIRGWTYTGLVWEPNRIIFDQNVTYELVVGGSGERCFNTSGTTLSPGFRRDICNVYDYQFRETTRIRIN